MQKQEFLELMQKYEANIAISGTTLRNQGPKGTTGVAEAAREFLSALDLSELKKTKPADYPRILDKWTNDLKQKLPKRAKRWGTARKAINVFMVQIFLNKYLAEEYGLGKLKDVLETPLDSQVAKGLRKLAGRRKLPRWTGIKSLTPESSAKYQEFASQVAKQNGLFRTCLDIIFWRPKKVKKSQ